MNCCMLQGMLLSVWYVMCHVTQNKYIICNMDHEILLDMLHVSLVYVSGGIDGIVGF